MWLEYNGWQDIHILKVERNRAHPHAPPDRPALGPSAEQGGALTHSPLRTGDPGSTIPHMRLFPALVKVVFIHEGEKSLTRHNSHTYCQLPNEKTTSRRTWLWWEGQKMLQHSSAVKSPDRESDTLGKRWAQSLWSWPCQPNAWPWHFSPARNNYVLKCHLFCLAISQQLAFSL